MPTYAHQTGKHAKITIGAITILNMVNVQCKKPVQFLSSDEWGSEWDTPEPDMASWEITGKVEPRTATSGNVIGYAELGALTAKNPSSQVLVYVYVYPVDGGASTHEGWVWMGDSDMEIPRGKLSHSITLKGYGAPVKWDGVVVS